MFWNFRDALVLRLRPEQAGYGRLQQYPLMLIGAVTAFVVPFHFWEGVRVYFDGPVWLTLFLFVIFIKNLFVLGLRAWLQHTA